MFHIVVKSSVVIKNSKKLISVILCHANDNFFSFFSNRKLTDEFSYDVRLIDYGDILTRASSEIYALSDEYKQLPAQAYSMHLTGIVPADHEDDWDEKITQKLQKLFTKLNTNESNVEYEAQVLFTLRNVFVVDMIRVINSKDCYVHVPVKEYLIEQKFAIESKDRREHVINMAKSNGKFTYFFSSYSFFLNFLNIF